VSYLQSFLSGYKANPNSFQQPLPASEELKYFEMYKNGSEDARNILIERNLRLVAHIVKKYNSSRSDCDDFISIGTIGLLKAISTFDHLKGTKFATYASRYIDNEILMQIRKTKKLKNEVSLNDPIGVDKEGNEISLIDLLSDEAESVGNEVELKMQIHRLYIKMRAVLKGHEKTILEMRYGLSNKESKTQSEIGSLLGISRSYVSRIEKKAISKLRKELNTENST